MHSVCCKQDSLTNAQFTLSLKYPRHTLKFYFVEEMLFLTRLHRHSVYELLDSKKKKKKGHLRYARHFLQFPGKVLFLLKDLILLTSG